jgi:hypothetical protein
MRALLGRLIFGTEELSGLSDLEHVTVCGMNDDTSNRLCIFLFRIEGLGSSNSKFG